MPALLVGCRGQPWSALSGGLQQPAGSGAQHSAVPGASALYPRPYYWRVQQRVVASLARPMNAASAAAAAADPALTVRRRVYAAGAWAQPPQRGGGAAAAAGFGAGGARVPDRYLEVWATRELRGLLLEEDVGVLVAFIMALLRSFGVAHSPPADADQGGDAGASSGTARAMGSPVAALREFLFDHAPHFWHELRSYALSGLSVAAYDAAVAYPALEEADAAAAAAEAGGAGHARGRRSAVRAAAGDSTTASLVSSSDPGTPDVSSGPPLGDGPGGTPLGVGGGVGSPVPRAPVSVPPSLLAAAALNPPTPRTAALGGGVIACRSRWDVPPVASHLPLPGASAVCGEAAALGAITPAETPPSGERSLSRERRRLEHRSLRHARSRSRRRQRHRQPRSQIPEGLAPGRRSRSRSPLPSRRRSPRRSSGSPLNGSPVRRRRRERSPAHDLSPNWHARSEGTRRSPLGASTPACAQLSARHDASEGRHPRACVHRRGGGAVHAPGVAARSLRSVLSSLRPTDPGPTSDRWQLWEPGDECA
jgi:hypothetical protein